MKPPGIWAASIFNMRTTVFPARFEYLDEIRRFAAQAAHDAGLDEAEAYAVQLAVDEACSNIIEHAYGAENGGEIECTCNDSGSRLTIILRDHGKPFDPACIPTPNLKAGLEKRQVGGLGLYLIRQLMDEVHYESIDGAGNILTLVKYGKSGN
ncbi:MAG: ATP-binding protein [Chloroflexi bacterium]|nr:ATP-binding protein [Chloroflexota bacterium]